MSLAKTRTLEVWGYQLTPENSEDIAGWTKSEFIEVTDPLDPKGSYVGLNIKTPDGMVIAAEGDYVFRDGMDFFIVSEKLYKRLFQEVPRKVNLL